MAGLKITKFGQQRPSHNLARCSICRQWTDLPMTDHCHTHGWVRGETCGSCNYYMARFDSGDDLSDPKWAVKRAPTEVFADHAKNCPECDPDGPAIGLAGRRMCAWPGGCNRPAQEGRIYCGVSDNPGKHGFPAHDGFSAGGLRRRLRLKAAKDEASSHVINTH